MIFKLLKLSGLSWKKNDLEEICHILRKQIQYIDILQNVKLTENDVRYDTNSAYLLPRKNAPLKYNYLSEFIEKKKIIINNQMRQVDHENQHP